PLPASCSPARETSMQIPPLDPTLPDPADPGPVPPMQPDPVPQPEPGREPLPDPDKPGDNPDLPPRRDPFPDTDRPGLSGTGGCRRRCWPGGAVMPIYRLVPTAAADDPNWDR